MKDVRHEHPLNDPEHQRACPRCKLMDSIGVSFAEWIRLISLDGPIDHEALTTFLLVFLSNVAIDDAMGEEGEISEAGLQALRERFAQEAAQAFDAAVLGLRSEMGA